MVIPILHIANIEVYQLPGMKCTIPLVSPRLRVVAAQHIGQIGTSMLRVPFQKQRL